MAKDESETPDFSNFDFSDEGSDDAGTLDDVDLTPQFEDLGDPMDDLQPPADDADLSEPSDGGVAGGDDVAGSDADQLDVLEQEEGSEEEGGEEEETSQEEDERESLLTRLGQTSPYTVMLAMALVAILIAITCLFLELNLYEFDIKAEDGRPPSSAAEIVYPGPPNTTATA